MSLQYKQGKVSMQTIWGFNNLYELTIE